MRFAHYTLRHRYLVMLRWRDGGLIYILPWSIVKVITSRDNPFFKQLVKLAASTKQRRAADLVLLDGVHLVSAYRRALGSPENVIVSESGYKDAEIMQLLAERGERQEAVTMLSDALFRQISPVKTPIGIMALVPILSREAIPVHEGENFCVLLE